MKTELFAGLFGVTAIWLAVRALDEPDPPARYAVAIGVLFGLTLLSRRVGFVLIAALVPYTFWYRHHRRSFALRSTLRQGAIAAGVGLASLLVAMLAMAGDAGMAWVFFDMYFLDLFRSGGFGAHGYLPLFGEDYVWHQYANIGPQTWFQAICQKCGQRTILVFIRVLLAALVVVIPLLVWLRAYIDKVPVYWLQTFVPAMLAVQAAFGLVLLILGGTGYAPKTVALTVFIAAVVYVWGVDTPAWGDLSKPRVGLMWLILILLASAYLYRDRILYPTYFQDFYPFVAVLGGIALAETWNIIGPIPRPSLSARRVRKVGAVILLLAFYTSALGSYPYVGDAPSESYSNWYTVDRVEAYGWDIDHRLTEDERVFAANPLYVTESEHRLVADLSRRYYLFEGWPETQVTKRLAADINEDLRSDDVPVAVMTSELRTVLAANESVNETFHAEFCRINDPLYETSKLKSIWVKRGHPRMPTCGANIDRSDYVMDQVT